MVYWFGGAQREELAHRRAVEDIIDFLAIQHVRKSQAGRLSDGLRKRVELARAMAVRPKLLALHARAHGAKPALREKDFGIWRRITWAGYSARTRAIALGLRAFGIGPGETAGLIGDNRPDWVMG